MKLFFTSRDWTEYQTQSKRSARYFFFNFLSLKIPVEKAHLEGTDFFGKNVTARYFRAEMLLSLLMGHGVPLSNRDSSSWCSG